MKLSFRYLSLIFIIIGIPAVIYVISAASYLSKCTATRKSCREHREAGCNISGEYNIAVSGSRSVEVTCDMDTDKGGWTLVGNYLHRKGSPGAPQVLETGKFPIQDQMALGMNETGEPSWGHISNATLSLLNFKEVRFRCQTSGHQRLLDFAISAPQCLKYFRTGTGSCIGTSELKEELVKGTRSLPGNGAHLPEVADKGWKDQGDFAMVNYPFFLDYKHHWSVGRLPGRFECDDYDSGNTVSTHHQIFVR